MERLKDYEYELLEGQLIIYGDNNNSWIAEIVGIDPEVGLTLNVSRKYNPYLREGNDNHRVLCINFVSLEEGWYCKETSIAIFEYIQTCAMNFKTIKYHKIVDCMIEPTRDYYEEFPDSACAFT